MQLKHGFLISRFAQDMAKGHTQLEFWVKSDAEIAKLVVCHQEPVFFVADNQTSLAIATLNTHFMQYRYQALDLLNFSYEKVNGFYFKTMKQAQRASALLQEQNIDVLEASIKLLDRFLMERFICGGVCFVGDPIVKNGYIEYHNVQMKASSYTTHLSPVSLDIECSEKGHLYCIGLDCAQDSRVIMIGERPVARENKINIQWVDNEKALLYALNDWFAIFDPDLIIGWNVIDFDFRLLSKRAAFYRVPLTLGRGKKPIYWRENQDKKGFVTVAGRGVLDGIDTLKNASYSFYSWSLESVAQQLLGEGKTIDKNLDKMTQINHLFMYDKCELAAYNLQDCILVNRIFDKTHLLAYLMERSRLTGIELERIGGSVAAFTHLYLPRLHRAGFVAPSLKGHDWISSPGGYVMDSKPALYDSVLVLDYKSLYPSIIRTFFIDPLGLIEGLREPIKTNTVPGFRGAVFHREKHFLPKMIEQLWQARDEAKSKGEKAFSQAIKVIMNSFYGVLGSSGCRFFDNRLASSITMRGHEIMKTTKDLIESKGYQVIYGDTDSTFVSLKGAYDTLQADEIGQSLVRFINHWWVEYLAQHFQIKSKLEIEYEIHYSRFLMPKIRGQERGSKKRYAGLVKRANGEQKMIYKGLETVRTDWTLLAQSFQQALYEKVFAGEKIEDFIRQTVNDTLRGNNDDQLIYKKRLRRKLSEYEKNIPPHVKAARLADSFNLQQGRALQYQYGGSIEYVMTLEGAQPVQYRTCAYDYQHYVDKQLKPIADGILPFIGKDFEQIIGMQLGLF